MDGDYQINKREFHSVEEWYNACLQGKISYPFTEHLEAFFQIDLSSGEVIRAACDIYQKLTKKCLEDKTIDKYLPLLVIPLPVSFEKILWGNSSLDEHLNQEEPPSIYLLDRVKPIFQSQTKGFIEKVTLDLPINITEIKKNTNCYYRSEHEDSSNLKLQEFYRNVYIGYNLHL
jgi:hypothetical protein